MGRSTLISLNTTQARARGRGKTAEEENAQGGVQEEDLERKMTMRKQEREEMDQKLPKSQRSQRRQRRTGKEATMELLQEEELPDRNVALQPTTLACSAL